MFRFEWQLRAYKSSHLRPTVPVVAAGKEVILLGGRDSRWCGGLHTRRRKRRMRRP